MIYTQEYWYAPSPEDLERQDLEIKRIIAEHAARARKAEHREWRIKSGIATGKLYTDEDEANLHRAFRVSQK